MSSVERTKTAKRWRLPRSAARVLSPQGQNEKRNSSPGEGSRARPSLSAAPIPSLDLRDATTESDGGPNLVGFVSRVAQRVGPLERRRVERVVAAFPAHSRRQFRSPSIRVEPPPAGTRFFPPSAAARTVFESKKIMHGAACFVLPRCGRR